MAMLLGCRSRLGLVLAMLLVAALGWLAPRPTLGAVPPTELDQVRGLATGSEDGLALRADGSVWASSKNDHGQVGVPRGEDCPYHPRPCVQATVPVLGLSGMKAVAVTEDSSFALGAEGTVWVWGANGHGQLGLGPTAVVANRRPGF